MSAGRDRHVACFLKAVERRAKQQEEQTKQQAEQQAINEQLQKQLLALADLQAQIDVFQNADNASTKTTETTSVTTSNTGKISDEQYQTAIIQKMKAHIKSKG
jgi:transglutaminase/protease-like cytokinesis protein 3